MATRPWVTPNEVRDYSDIAAVQNRDDEKLKIDIFRAEQRVIALTGNRFDRKDMDGGDIYPEAPASVKTAVILLTEMYAKRASEASREMTMKSETYDDYSYTAENTVITEDDLGLDDLLRDYYVADTGGNVTLRIRKL